ncbi:zwei Ig domain protein zig-1 [Polymixia lowei]
MKGLLVTFLIAVIHGSHAALVIKGPSEPILSREPVTLECLSTNPDVNISQVHFESFSKYTQTWYRLDPESSRYHFRCMAVDYFAVENKKSRLVLYISSASTYQADTFRCVSDDLNATAPENSSEPLTLKVHFMEELRLHRTGLTYYLDSGVNLKVLPGEDVEVECSVRSSETPEYFWQKEGGDWILPSSKLSLKKVGALDAGMYTCTAQNPTVASLRKSRAITVSVLSDDASWYETSTGRLVLMTSAAAVALLVFVLSVSVFLCRRAKSSKGPINDGSQKKPIYRNSVESLPSTCGDKQPLV